METYFQRKDHSLFPVSIVGSTFIDEETKEKRLILLIDDITKSKETERELKISQLLLLSLIQNLEKKVKERTYKIEQLLKQKNEFINQLGHDLKNPLGPLINLIPILLKHETDPRKKEMLTVIQRNTNHMKNLITKTIELAQLNSGNVKLHFEKVDLTKICHESIIRNKHLLTKNNITVENNLSECIVVKADPVRIDELFNNIITNAAKYSPDGGKITILGSSTETTVSITIRDTGVGMNKHQLQHVFDEFYKADPARHDFKSSGLGTSICKRIVEKHGGHIKIESDGIGKGTTVTFTLQKNPLSLNTQKSHSAQEKNKINGGENK
jgi:signal transduction histidine kinase